MPKSNYQNQARAVLRGFLNAAFAYEKKEMVLLANKWGVVSGHLTDLITKLSQQEVLSADKLFKLDLYQQFLKESKLQTDAFNKYAEGVVTRGQEVFAKLGIESAQESINLLNVRFNRMNINAINNMIGISQEGSPLYSLFAKSYPESVAKLTNTLINATAMGYNPKKTAQLLGQNMDGNLTRALRIARTEQLNILRNTSIEQMRESGVCVGWIRIEQSDCCVDCAPYNGKHYGFDETFDTHPNCRGACIPDVNTK